MTITVLHMRRIDTLTQMALTARMERGDTSPAVAEMRLREGVRRPSLGWSAERLEALHDDAPRRKIYFRALALKQECAARLLYDAGGYEPVARIEGCDLEAAYALTTFHPDRPTWTAGGDARVTVLVDDAFDSHVGDLFRDDATGHVHLCLGLGFSDLGPLDQPKAA